MPTMKGPRNHALSSKNIRTKLHFQNKLSKSTIYRTRIIFEKKEIYAEVKHWIQNNHLHDAWCFKNSQEGCLVPDKGDTLKFNTPLNHFILFTSSSKSIIAASIVLEDMELRQRLLSLLFFAGYSLSLPLMVAISKFSTDESMMCKLETLSDSSISIPFLALLPCFLLPMDLSG